MDRLPKMPGQKFVDSNGYIFHVKTEIQTMDRFPKVQDQNIVERPLRLSI